jgi:nitrate/nitrite transporter NarK
VLHLIGLIVAGEAIFTLPFHVARFFRPTVLSVFDLTNTELGAAQAVYGVVAMIAYVPGGPLADRYPARSLLAASLVATGLGGLWFATIPGGTGLGVLFGVWGFTTILLFWAALIRSTREWGGHDEQGRAYGLLDGGRGLLAAALASLAAAGFAAAFPEDAAAVTPEERRRALQAVILAYTGVTLCTAMFVWWAVPATEARARKEKGSDALQDVWGRLRRVARIGPVWWQAVIVVSAYVAYKGFDDISLFAHDAYGMTEVEAGQFTSTMQWIRPVAAVAAGLLADRLAASRVVGACFAALLAADVLFAISTPVPSAAWLLVANVTVTCLAMFGLRGVYFALFEEAEVPTVVTGTAVGLVSLIGYTPDVFVSLVAGILVDRSPGVAGHQHFFWFLAGFAALGLVATFAFVRSTRRRHVV